MPCPARRRPWWAAALAAAVAASSLSLPLPADAASPEPRPHTAVAAEKALRDDAPGEVAVVRGPGGVARLIGTKPGRAVPVTAFARGRNGGPESRARQFLTRYGALLGVKDTSSASLAHERTVPLAGGQQVVRFTETRGGLPVLGGEVVVTVQPDGDVVSANGETAGPTVVPLEAEVTSDAAKASAVLAISRAERRHRGELVVDGVALWAYDPALVGAPGLPGTRPVWRVELSARKGEPLDGLVLVDARTGAIALQANRIAHVRNRVLCDNAEVVTDAYACTSPSRYVREEGDPATGNADVDNAYDNAGATADWYQSTLGVDLTDLIGVPEADGKALRATTRFCPRGLVCPYQNAFWDGEQMVYGTGFARADDVVAHELTHGVTQHTANLLYYYQSGAINESMSDVFGELLDLAAEPVVADDPATDWQLGEDLIGVGAIRDMADPTLHDDPDRMTSPDYDADPDFGDSGGVHTNSGVGNKAAYLIAAGGTFNGRTVTALGTTKTAHLYWETLNLLTSGSDYADLAALLPQACTNLASVGTAGFTTGDCTEVADAVAAVEMSKQPTVSGASAPEVPKCPSGEAPNGTIFADGMENPSSGKWGFGSTDSLAGWSYPTGYAHGGVRSLNGYYDLDSDGGTSDARMTSYQAIPSNGRASLWFAHAYDFAYDGVYRGGGWVEYRTSTDPTWRDAGGMLASPTRYPGSFTMYGGAKRSGFRGWSNGYRSSRLDLAPLAGKSVRFRFRVSSQAGGDVLGWVVDDVSLHTCPAMPGVPSDATWKSSATSVTLSWQPPASGGTVSGYAVRMDGTTVASLASSARSHTFTGFTKGKDHRFSVAAKAPSGSTGPEASRTLTGTRLTTSLSSATVSYGGTTKLSGTLVRSSGSALSGKTVRLYSRAVGASTWAAGSTRTTTSTGGFSWSLEPSANREYRVEYPAGSSVYLGARSSVVTVQVRPLVTLSLSDSTVEAGTLVRFTGTVSPAHAGATVHLQRYETGAWVTKKSGTLASDSTYSITWTPSSRTDYRWRVYLPSHTDHAVGYSPARTLYVS